MNINELMINDWVQLDGGYYKVAGLGLGLKWLITLISGYKRVYEDNNSVIKKEDTIQYATPQEYLNAIKPIPITYKILFDNSFCSLAYDELTLYHSSHVYMWDDARGKSVTVNMDTNNIKIEHDSRVLLDLLYDHPVAVHELQHALRLCCIDKDIIV